MEKPKHEDIEKYGYTLWPCKGKWYASYDHDKGTQWHLWNGTDFDIIEYRDVPEGIIDEGPQ